MKHFRTKYDTEYNQTESILGKTELQQKKKEMDKAIINAIRICVMSGDHEKVFAFMNMINFTQTLKICVNFCDSVNANELAQKISKFIQDKEQKEIMLGTFKDLAANQAGSSTTGGSRFDRNRPQKPAQMFVNNVTEKPDLSRFAVNTQQSQSSVLLTQSQ